MSKVLIITRDFVPYAESLGGVLRMLAMADFLHRSGHQVFVLASKGYSFGYFGYENEVAKYTIRYVDDFLKYNKDKKSSAPKGPPGFKDFLVANFRGFIRKTIVPDKHLVLVPSYTAAACEIIAEYGIANVIVSSPPFSLQMIGLNLKKRFQDKIMYMADYRDSWNSTAIHTPNNPVSRLISNHLERKVILSCNHFTYVSAPILTKVAKKFGTELLGKATLVMNGFSQETNGSLTPTPDERIAIGYFGSISDSNTSFRDVTNLLLAFKDPGFHVLNIELRVFGKIELKRHNLSEFSMVKYYGSVSHGEALRQMSLCDYLLIVHSECRGSDEVVTGKFFEYIAARRPIICLGPPNMEANRLLQEHKLGISIDIHSVQVIIETLNELSKPIHDIANGRDISIFHRDKQYSKVLPLLR